MIREIVNYIKDSDFKIVYLNNSVNIINYGSILEVKDDVITIKKNNHVIFIRGKELKIDKLLDEEILITGEILQIEL